MLNIWVCGFVLPTLANNSYRKTRTFHLKIQDIEINILTGSRYFDILSFYQTNLGWIIHINYLLADNSFVFVFYCLASQVNSYGHGKRSVHLTTFFPGQA